MVPDSATKDKFLSDADHRRLTVESGITEAVLTQRGYYTARTQAELAALGFTANQQRAPALVVPIFDVYGHNSLCQIRPAHPRPGEQNKPIKYETPTEHCLRLDVHPAQHSRLEQADMPLIVVEGVRKEDSVLGKMEPEDRFCVLGLLGVYGWKRDKKPHPDWYVIPLKGRQVIVVYDSDVLTNGKVAQARNDLARFLT